MIVWDSPKIVNEFVSQHGGGRAYPEYCQALGYVEENGRLTAGLVFSDTNGVNCNVNIALTNGNFPISLLKAGLSYCFDQLKLKRLTFLIEESNILSQTLCANLGAIHEATLRDAGKTGNMLIYALFPDACKIWSRINGKERRRADPA